MIFKTTILKSNPQVIRVFEMDAAKSLQDLLDLVAVIHGWKKNEKMTIYKNGREMLETEVLSAHFIASNTSDEWEIRKDMGTPIRYSDEVEKWHIRLEVEDYSEPKDASKVPCVIRFRGLNPKADIVNISRWNTMAITFEQSPSYYDYGFGYMNRKDYEFKLKEVNAGLHKKVSTGTGSMNIAWGRCIPMEELLARYKFDDLKRIYSKVKAPFNRMQKKVELIASIREAYRSSDTYGSVLESLSLCEYEELKLFITGKRHDLARHSDTLRAYGLFHSEYKEYGGYLAKEFGQYLEGRILEEGEDNLLDMKKLEEVLTCAGNLYGMFPWGLAYELGEIMYPELDFDTLLDEVWYPHGRFAIVEIEDPFDDMDYDDWDDEYDIDIMYDTESLHEGTAVNYWKLICSTDMEHYLPSREEAIRIARNGMTFSGKARQEIKNALEPLQKSYRYYPTDRMVDTIYRMCHLNIMLKEYPAYLKRAFSLEGKPAEFSRLMDVIRKHKEDVRQVLFCGYTGKEAKQLYHLELEER